MVKHGEVVTDSEGLGDEDMPPLEDCSDAGSIEEAVQGDLPYHRRRLYG